MINEPILDLQITIFFFIGTIIFLLVYLKLRELKYYLPTYVIFPFGYLIYYLHHFNSIYRLIGNVIMALTSILFLIGTIVEYSHVVENRGKISKKVAAVALSPVMLVLIGVQLILFCIITLSLVFLLKIFRETRNPRHVSLLLFQAAGFLSVLSRVLDNFQVTGAWEFSYLTTIIFAVLTLTMPVVAYFEHILVSSEKKYHMAYNRAELYKDLFAHDISNILQYIKSSIDIFELYHEESQGKEMIKKTINILNEQTIRGSNLIKNIRKLSELSEAENRLQRNNLLSYLHKNIEYVNKNYNKREIFISLVPSQGEYYIWANEMFLLVGENILINAVKYNKNPLTEISIEISRVEKKNVKYYKLEFKDNGIGISDEVKKTLFRDTIRKESDPRGMGLGLLLVKKILDKFNGQIWVENNIKDEPTMGSNFVILIPEAE